MPAKKQKKQSSAKHASVTTAAHPCANFLRAALPQVTGALILLVSLAFFTGTYDSAHVKLTLFQMGSVLLFSLWGALKLTEHKNPFTRKTLPFLVPLFIYMAWQTLSFLCFPYKSEAAEEFIRLWLGAGLIGLIACEFTVRDIQTLTKWLIVTAWISFWYGALQIVNIWKPGADLLPWHGFFGHRIFATHANPNFFGAFIVFASAVVGAEFFRTRKKSLLVLLALGLIDLFFTESKGAWLAYGGTLVFVIFFYANYFSSSAEGVKFLHSRKKILLGLFGLSLLDLLFTKNGTWLLSAAMGILIALSYCFSNIKNYIKLIAALCLLTVCLIVGVYSKQRFQSVSFRAYTWLSAFEMVKDSPVLGTGPGSFKLVYPAYRRPQIFYIENAHNTETQHAENEILEQAATGGVVGLALSLWLLLIVFLGALHTLRRIPPTEHTRKWALLGYTAAGAGLLLHSTVDISIHFASSAVLFCVFMGAVFALILNNPPVENQPLTRAKYPYLLWAVRLIMAVGALAVGIILTREFYFILRNIAVQTMGEKILFAAAIVTFAACVLGGLYVYAQVLRKTRQVLVCLILLLTLPLYVFFFRFFAANHYYSLGVALVQLNQPEAALGAFNDTIKHNPFLAEYRHYRANIFATTLNLSKQFAPQRGDTDTARTDYDRAIEDFRFVLAHNPNHARLHQDIGQLYYSLAMRQLQAARQDPANAPLYTQLAQENFSLAKKAFTKSLALDPVNPDTYALLIDMAFVRHDLDEAQHWLDVYYQGPEGVTEEEFLTKHKEQPKLRFMQDHVNRLRETLAR